MDTYNMKHCKEIFEVYYYGFLQQCQLVLKTIAIEEAFYLLELSKTFCYYHSTILEQIKITNN